MSILDLQPDLHTTMISSLSTFGCFSQNLIAFFYPISYKKQTILMKYHA